MIIIIIGGSSSSSCRSGVYSVTCIIWQEKVERQSVDWTDVWFITWSGSVIHSFIFSFLLIFSNDVLLQFQIPYSLYPVHQKKKPFENENFSKTNIFLINVNQTPVIYFAVVLPLVSKYWLCKENNTTIKAKQKTNTTAPSCFWRRRKLNKLWRERCDSFWKRVDSFAALAWAPLFWILITVRDALPQNFHPLVPFVCVLCQAQERHAHSEQVHHRCHGVVPSCDAIGWSA